jgi:hypothetical protein
MSTLKVNRIEPRTGDSVEIVGLDIPDLPESPVKAWVNFNGTDTVAIRDSMNISSITDVSVGSYHVNFATDMPDVNYVGHITAGKAGGGISSSNSTMCFTTEAGGHKTNRYFIQVSDGSGNTHVDRDWINVSIIR